MQCSKRHVSIFRSFPIHMIQHIQRYNRCALPLLPTASGLSTGLAFFALTGYITNDISTKYIDASHIGGTNGHRACFWVGTGLSQASGARPALEDLDSPGSQ